MKSRSNALFSSARATLVSTGLSLSMCFSHAAEITKLDNTTALNDGLSWSGGTPPGSGDIALWDATVTAANATALGADLSWAGIKIANPGGLVTINAGNTLTLGNAGIDLLSAATQNLTLNPPIVLGDAHTWNVASGRTLLTTGSVDNGGFLLTLTGSGSRNGASPYTLSGITEISGALSGAGGLSKTGSGNVILSGTAANTFTGLTDIRGGNVFLNKPAGTHAIAGNVVIYASHLHLSASDQLADTAVIGSYSRSIGGQGGFNLRGFNETIAGLESTGENTSNGNGRLVVQRFDYAGGANSNSAVDSTLTLSDSADHNFYGYMRNTDDGSSGKLNVVKEGSGRQLFGPRDAAAGSTATTFTYNGTTTINGGTLALQNMFSSNNSWQSAITINAGGTLELLQGTAGASMNDAVSGAGIMTKTGNQATTLTATALHTGGTQVKAGSLILAGGANNRLATTAPLTLGDAATAGKLVLGNDAGASSQEIGVLASTGLGGSVVGGNAAASTLTFTAASGTSIFTGSLGGSGTNENSLAITKLGAGQFVVNGTASYSGATTVSGGSLLLNNSSGTLGAVSLASGTGFGRSTPGSLSVNSLTLGAAGGDTATLFTMLGGPTSLVVTSAGGLAANGGAGSVTVNVGGAVTATGTYPLIDYAGSLGGGLAAFQLGSLPPRVGATLVDNVANGSIDLNVTSLDSARWNGNQGQDWTTASNWVLNSNGTTTSYIENDSVVFTDSATGTTDIVVGQADVSPSLITFDNSLKDYTLTQQNGKDILTGSLVKTGSGKLTIDGSFSFAGGSTLTGGTVSINNETALGTGTRTMNGGTLEYTGATTNWIRATTVNAPGGTLSVTDSGAVLTHSGAISGSGVLTKAGAGTLALGQTSGTVNTPINIAAGTLTLNYAGGAVTYAGNITGTTGVLRLEGTGASATTGLTLTGNNTFSGETHVYGRRIFLNSATPNGGLGGNIIVKNGNWPYHGLSLMANEQIVDNAVLRFEQTNGPYNFLLNGKTETLAGIESIGSETQGDPGAPGNWAIVSNAGYDGGNDANGMAPGTLIVAGSGSYDFHGQLRDQNNTGGNNKLAFTKAGTGTQTLEGAGITYSGPTLVSGGTLVLDGATGFKSPAVTVQTGAILQVNGATTLSNTPALTIAAGGFLKAGNDGAGTYSVPAAQTLAGSGSVTGSLSIDGTVSPGNSIGTLTSTGYCDFLPDSRITWEVGGNWASPTADSIHCQGFGVFSDNVDPIVITVTPLGVTGFSETAKTFTLVQGTEPGQGFSADKFQIDATAFATATGSFGTWSIQEIGNNLELVYTPGSATPFQLWAAANIANADDRDPLDDPDQDGLENVLEFVTNGNPASGTSINLPTITDNGASITFTFTRRDDSESLNPTVEFDADLVGTWTTAVDPGNCTIVVTENGANPDSVAVTIPKGANTKLFARLKVNP